MMPSLIQSVLTESIKEKNATETANSVFADVKPWIGPMLCSAAWLLLLCIWWPLRGHRSDRLWLQYNLFLPMTINSVTGGAFIAIHWIPQYKLGHQFIQIGSVKFTLIALGVVFITGVLGFSCYACKIRKMTKKWDYNDLEKAKPGS